MKTKQNILLGVIITIIIFALTLTRKYIFTDFSISGQMLYKLSVELILSIIAIYLLKPNFNIKPPKLIPALKVFFIGFGVTVLIMVTLNLIEILITGKPNKGSHPVLNAMNIYQVFLFVFIGASITEEMLFRGFLLNIISPLKIYKLRLFKKHIGLHIIISALLFGAAHLILLTTGVGFGFVYKIVIMTFIIGLFAGYFQEKYNNTSYAILTHMGANLMGVIGMLIMQFVDLP